MRRNQNLIQQLSLNRINGPFDQRWNRGTPTWKHPDQGGFDARKYEVAEILDDTTAEKFIVQEHYSHSYPAALRRYGLYTGNALVGVAVFSAPTNVLTLTRPFPDLLPYHESMELGRFVLRTEAPSNSESFFLKKCFQLLKREGVRGVVSFADPVARSNASGQTIFGGHIGHIYQISSALFTGRGTPRTLLLLPDGKALNERTLQKIRAQESGHESAEDVLVTYGARPLGSRDDPRAWLRESLQTIGVRKLRHPGAYRYLFDLGGRIIHPRIGLDILPYPRRSEGELEHFPIGHAEPAEEQTDKPFLPGE